jgi:hypothetical protein
MKGNLKKLNLIVIGSLVVLSVAGFNLLKHFGARLDKNSKEFVDAVIVEIAEDWDVQTFLRYASPDLHQSVNDEALKKAFRLFNRLGKIRKYNGAEGESKATFRLRDFKVDISATYFAQVEFSEGPGKVIVSLVRADDKWYIKSFNIDSELFLDQI